LSFKIIRLLNLNFYYLMDKIENQENSQKIEIQKEEVSTTNPPTQSNQEKRNSFCNKGPVLDPEDYVSLMQIGQGNFSELYMVEHKDTKILYTLKMFTKMRVESLKKQEDVLMEKHVMGKISEHRNIIKFYGSNKDEMFLYILYEYVNGGELWQKSVIYGLPSEKLIKFYFLQVLDGINHLHDYKIVHRDIKVKEYFLTHLARKYNGNKR
jgi:serine/threonine protein kinase